MEISTQNRRAGRRRRILVNVLSLTTTLLAAAFLVPSAIGLQRFVITGTSMTGTIDYGSVAFDEVVPISELEVGDIITYTPPAGTGVDHLVTHRIVSIHAKTFRTKGDAVPQRDPWKFQLNAPVQPRVKFAVPYAGFVFIALADRTTRMVVIGLPAGLIALISLLQVLAGLRRRPSVARPDGVASHAPVDPARALMPTSPSVGG